jgi:hypothetical protein
MVLGFGWEGEIHGRGENSIVQDEIAKVGIGLMTRCLIRKKLNAERRGGRRT